MDLAHHQRRLLELIRSGTPVAAEGDDDYVRHVAQSRDLQEARGNIFLWRIYVLERTAALSVALLKRRGLLETSVCAFIESRNISPFRETQAPAFLQFLSEHTDPLVACVAGTELALLRVREGDRSRHVIAWHVEPSTVLHSLVREEPFSEVELAGDYEVTVSHDLPGRLHIASVQRAPR